MSNLRARFAAMEPPERGRFVEVLTTLLYSPPETSEEVDAFLRAYGIDPEALATKAHG